MTSRRTRLFDPHTDSYNVRRWISGRLAGFPFAFQLLMGYHNPKINEDLPFFDNPAGRCELCRTAKSARPRYDQQQVATSSSRAAKSA